MILRVCVVIPCFEQHRTISQVVKGVIQNTRFPILLVDDGSELPVSHFLYSFEVKEALEQERVRVLRLEKPRGRGKALRVAIEELIQEGYTHILTFPPDGSGRAEDLNKLIEEGRKHPWALVTGRRENDHVTRQSSESRFQKLMDCCVRFETGSQVQDPCSPIKLYPLFALQELVVRSVGQDWELEVLVRLLWRGWEVREIPVLLMSAETSEVPTQMELFGDRLRLGLLNIALLCMSTLRRHSSPTALALASALGGIIGAVPLSGFHFLVALVLAVTLPLNFLAIWLSAKVAALLSASPLADLQVRIGQSGLGIGYSQGQMGHVYQWLGGVLVTAPLLGALIAAVTFVAARRAQRVERLGGRPTRFLGLILRQMVRRFGNSVIPMVSRPMALWSFVFSPQKWLGLNEFYRLLYPEMSLGERQKNIYAHFCEVCCIRLEAWSGLNRSDRPMQSPSSVATLTFNFGGPLPTGCEFVDQPKRRNCELIPFLGRLAPFDPSSLDTAVRQGRDVVMSCMLRQGEGDYERLDLLGPKRFGYSQETPPEVQRLTWLSHGVARLEACVRQNPKQWLNLFPFWSTIPSGQSGAGVMVEDMYEVTPPMSMGQEAVVDVPAL